MSSAKPETRHPTTNNSTRATTNNSSRYIPARRIILPSILVLAGAMASLSLLGGHIAQFYGTYLVLGIVGNGTAQLAYSRAVLTWFERRRGLALSIVLTGSGRLDSAAYRGSTRHLGARMARSLSRAGSLCAYWLSADGSSDAEPSDRLSHRATHATREENRSCFAEQALLGDLCLCNACGIQHERCHCSSGSIVNRTWNYTVERSDCAFGAGHLDHRGSTSYRSSTRPPLCATGGIGCTARRPRA